MAERAAVARRALTRGWRRRCPHCGVGPIFSGWSHHLDRCSHCGLVYERNPGDTWAFTVIGDRIPIGLLIGVIYFGVARSHMTIGVVLFVIVGVLVVWTAPNRWGIGIALHYLSRRYSRDPDDPVPNDNHEATTNSTRDLS